MYFFFTNHGPQLFCRFSAKYLPTHFVRLFTLIGQSVHCWAFFANHVGKEIWKVFWQSCLCFRLFNYKHKHGVLQRPMLNAVFVLIYRNELVYDRNHYFGLGLIPKPKPKLADYQKHISKEESTYQQYGYFLHHKRARKTKFTANY